ncbi:MAG: hypothetical protein NVSMB55_09330 [Mycobacteriales bacterium]
MTPPSRVHVRRATRCASAAGALGIVLAASPAWALELPSPIPTAPLPVVSTPALPLPTGPAPAQQPAPAASPSPQPAPTALPSPVASALAPVLSHLPAASPSARPASAHSPTPTSAAAGGSSQQQARAAVAAAPIQAPAPLPAPLALRPGTGPAALRSLPGILAPVLAGPQAIVPQLAPTPPTTAAQPLPRVPAPDGLPAVVVALAIGCVAAAAAGQVADLAERRRTASH